MARFAGTEEIDVYPVGWLADIKRAWRCLTVEELHGRRGNAWRILRQRWQYTTRQAKRGNWRAVRQSFNGYLAEHPTRGTRCGTGWTRRRALNSLARHLDESGA